MNHELKQADLVIWVVGNGYRVNPTRYNMSSDSLSPKADERVFESFDSLVGYLRSVLPIYPVFAGTITTTIDMPKKPRRR